jgi:hypothetical protein
VQLSGANPSEYRFTKQHLLLIIQHNRSLDQGCIGITLEPRPIQSSLNN